MDNLILFADSTLTVENLIKVMDKVTLDERRRMEIWGDVLHWHGRTPHSYLDEVYSSDKEKTPALADVYVNIRPESSWQGLAQTLYRQGEMAAAKVAKSIFQHNGE